MTKDLQQKLSHFQLDGENAGLLREVGELLKPELDAVLTAFYKRAQANPDTAAFFDGPERMEYARNAQKKHWTRLLSGEFDAEYMASVDRIGRTHARIDLPLDTYMSAYSLATTDLVAALFKRIPRRKRSRLAVMVGVLTRAFALDIERVVETTFRILAEEQTAAFGHIDTAIEKLAQGDLTHVIPGPDSSDYPKRFDDVRRKLNGATENLRETMTQVTGTMSNLVKIIEEVSAAADDLSERTANQAASLEETAAAVHELTENVASSAKNTQEANQVAATASQTALEGARTVEEASGAMTRIQTSSDQITRIIGLIDDIAFQTNLLALNAGVEAARAGSAGSGFAVVAEEVRVLAGNASDAARQITELVSNSSKEVTSGVDLIDNAGRNLKAIVESFEKVSGLSAAIAAASSEQSTALSEVNSAVSQMDSVTQQNAAMVEQTTAAASIMRQNATEVAAALAGLKIGGTAAQRTPRPTAQSQAA
ncbi:methyl-accepting chemotaxis protein [Mameliella alba]|uniref:methyl-accepting chemotaxis protein n=1 Tax=Mameliella alba TaxID=561184 RepID=UPI000B52CF75|nr:globin-coupled sensor protein [Mameliella alba]MBY6118739.1 globin-coupled sensor protein [Mameliella alba]OWV43679.1 chemotaxis protein [Mameliella alba]OWV67349.1 chemotaxis protein [Mameliella alba]